jgi:hypothetical protein
LIADRAESHNALTRLRRDCAPGSPLDIVIVALAQTIRRFFDAVEQFDLTTLRCDSRDLDWLAFESALLTLRKSIGFQINALADSSHLLILFLVRITGLVLSRGS